MSTFNNDLENGQQEENRFKEFLIKEGCTVTSTQTLGKFSGYDLQAYYPPRNLIFTVEVKKDFKSTTTGRVAVEVAKKNLDNNEENSGLTATRANFYVYTFPNDENFYMIETKQLVNMYQTCQYQSLRWVGDGDRYKNMLIEKDEFIKQCKVVK